MKKIFTIMSLCFVQSLFSQETNQRVKYSEVNEQIKPSLFSNLGESCSTPDGMAIDKKGNLFLAVTNLSSFDQYGSKILTFDKNDKPITWFEKLPLNPISKRVHPMGIEFGPDGNLYIADNQSFAGQVNQSRILRIIVKDGVPLRTEVLVEGLNFANGIRINNNRIYVTDFRFANNTESGIYSFKIESVNKQKIVLTEETKPNYLISKFLQGIDGIAFDRNGNLYAGHFFSGTITKFELSEDGLVKSKNVIFDSEKLNCADGMFYDNKRNSIFIANLSNNSVHELDLNKNTVNLIWVNNNNNGADGLLDNPCETIIYKGDLIVVNFDTFKGEKNLEVDSYNTISKFIIND